MNLKSYTDLLDKKLTQKDRVGRMLIKKQLSNKKRAKSWYGYFNAAWLCLCGIHVSTILTLQQFSEDILYWYSP